MTAPTLERPATVADYVQIGERNTGQRGYVLDLDGSTGRAVVSLRRGDRPASLPIRSLIVLKATDVQRRCGYALVIAYRFEQLAYAFLDGTGPAAAEGQRATQARCLTRASALVADALAGDGP